MPDQLETILNAPRSEINPEEHPSDRRHPGSQPVEVLMSQRFEAISSSAVEFCDGSSVGREAFNAPCNTLAYIK